MSGWICSYRKIWGHHIFKGDAQRVGVWTWMLHTAAWKDTRFAIGRTIVPIKRGQLCISQRQAADETGMGRQALRSFLALLEQEGAITQKVTGTATHKRTVVTICKYEEYQAREESDNPKSNPPPTQQQPSKEQINNITTSSIEENAALPPEAQMIEVSVLSKAVWDAGKPFLASRGISNPGAMIGRWLKSHGAAEILSAIDAAQRAGTQDPVPYVNQILSNGGQNDRPQDNTSNRSDPAIEQMLRLAGVGQAPGAGGV